MSTGQTIAFWVLMGFLPVAAATGLLIWAVVKGWVASATAKRVTGFILFALISHAVLLYGAPDIWSALVGIVLVTTACAAIAYATWQRELLESVVYYNGVVVVLTALYLSFVLAAYRSETGQWVKEEFMKARDALAAPIDEYLDKRTSGTK